MLTATASFLSIFFQLQQYSRQHPSFSDHKAALMTKTDLRFSSIFFNLCILQFNSAFAVSFPSTPSHLRQVWCDFFWTNHNSLLSIATHEIALFCIDYRWLFFMFVKVGKGGHLSNWERFWNKKAVSSSLFLYYIKQIDSMLLCVCSVIDHRRHQNVVRTSVTHSAITLCSTFCSYHIKCCGNMIHWWMFPQLISSSPKLLQVFLLNN